MATETNWHFARGGQQSGPVALAELKALIAQGKVVPEDLVWHQGMGEWKAASEMPELSATPRAVPQPAAAHAGPVAIGYFTPAMGMPQRAVLNLRGHAHPTGDTGDWPLDDQRLDQFQNTLKLRKRVTAAASLYRALLALSAISFTVLFIVGLFTMSAPAARRNMPMIGLLPGVTLLLGFCLLYYFAERATRRSKRWAPLTMLIVFVTSGLIQIASIIMVSTGPSQVAISSVGLIVVLIFAAAFAANSWRAFAAIPKYLAQPAWCQELIVKAGL